MVVETSGLTGDNVLSMGKVVQPRNSITIHISIDLLLMMLDQLNMHDIEWLCLS